MRAMRPLSVMLWSLGYAAIPSWPAGVAAAIWWTGRAELLLLSLAGAGTSSAMALGALRWADARLARRAAEYERLEGLLVGAIGDLYEARHPTAPLHMIRGHRP
jgi:hypothetical protein